MMFFTLPVPSPPAKRIICWLLALHSYFLIWLSAFSFFSCDFRISFSSSARTSSGWERRLCSLKGEYGFLTPLITRKKEKQSLMSLGLLCKLPWDPSAGHPVVGALSGSVGLMGGVLAPKGFQSVDTHPKALYKWFTKTLPGAGH